MTVLKRFNRDDVAVAMKCEHDVAVDRAGTYGEPAHVIRVKFTDRHDDYVEFVGCLGGDIIG